MTIQGDAVSVSNKLVEKSWMKQVYMDFKNKVFNKTIPYNEMRYVLLNPMVKNALEIFSNKKSIRTMQVLCFNRNIFIKNYWFNQYYKDLRLKEESKDIQRFKKIFYQLLSINISSPEDCKNLEVFNELGVTEENITFWKNNWDDYLEENPGFKSAIINNNLNLDMFFWILVIFTVSYSFVFGGASTTLSKPDTFWWIVMAGEALIIQLSVAGITGLWYNTYPWIGRTIAFFEDFGIVKNFLDNHEYINSSLIKLQNISQNVLTPIWDTLFLNNTMMRIVTALTIGDFAAGVFAYCFMKSKSVQFLGGAIANVLPVLLFIAYVTLQEISVG